MEFSTNLAAWSPYLVFIWTIEHFRHSERKRPRNMEDISIEAGAVFVPTSLHRDNRRQFVPWVKSFQLFKSFSTNSHQDRVIYATELISGLEYSKTAVRRLILISVLKPNERFSLRLP